MGKTLSQIEVMDNTKVIPQGVAGAAPTPALKARGSRIPSPPPMNSRPTSTAPAPSRSVFGGLSVYTLLFTGIVILSLLFTIAYGVIVKDEQNTILTSQSARTALGIVSITLILVSISCLLLGNRDVTSKWGFWGYVFLTMSVFPLSMTLTTISFESLNSSSSAIAIFFGTFVLAFVFGMIYYGSTGSDSMRTAVFYGSSVLLIVYALFYTIIFGNPVGVSTTIPDSDLNSLDSNQYTIIYGSDNELNGVFKRRLFDQVYLSIAYPTLGMSDSPPLHNSTEIRGSHYLSEYGRYLKMGASAFLFDIFYESNASSPNVNTWRVGTINTQSGVVQNRRTISLASVLAETNRAIEMNANNHRLIYLFLNPRYLTSQKDMIPQLEDSLADLIQENITFLTLPSLSVTIPQNQKLETQNLNNARQQVGIFLGGTRLVSSLSSKLKNVIHGVVNFTDCYIRTNGAQAYNAIAYDPEQSNRRMNLGVGSFAGSNESRLSEFVPQDSLRSVQSSFVASLPDTPESDRAYTSDVPLYISHSVCFPFVYPETLVKYESNKVFFQGFAPIVSPKEIISMIFSNRDGETAPARQRMNAELRCEQMYKNARVLDPTNDDEWSNLIRDSTGQLAKNNWCQNYDEGKDGPTIVNEENPTIFPLVLYNPTFANGTSNGRYSGGMIPKPTLVQTNDGNIYQLRQVIQQETRVAQELD